MNMEILQSWARWWNCASLAAYAVTSRKRVNDEEDWSSKQVPGCTSMCKTLQKVISYPMSNTVDVQCKRDV